MSPVPSLVARAASRSGAATSDSPDASAISTTAARPSSRRSQRARIGRPRGSVASASRHCQPPAASIATRVPSPPSASGARCRSSPGRARCQPSASARATWTLVSEPLNESGAISTRSCRPVTSVRASPRWARRFSRYSGMRIIGGRSWSASSMTSSDRWSRPERGSFIVEPSSANRRTRRRSSSRFMTACRMTNDIRDRPSSSWLRWTRRRGRPGPGPRCPPAPRGR